MTHLREGWNDKFKEMAENGDDSLIDQELGAQSEWDEQEWEWIS
jgi:antitoxin MazE